jgi:hypothetical protein
LGIKRIAKASERDFIAHRQAEMGNNRFWMGNKTKKSFPLALNDGIIRIAKEN